MDAASATPRLNAFCKVHFPYPGVPMEETLRALDDLVPQGKVRYIGCSNFSGWQLVDANWIARTQGLARFISAQNPYNRLDRQIEKELVPACLEHGAGILPYFPLASGFLAGKFRPGQLWPAGARLANERPTTEHLTGVPDAVVRQVNPEILRWVTPEAVFTEENHKLRGALEAFAGARGHTILELAIGWLLSRPGVSSVLAGVRSMTRLAGCVETRSITPRISCARNFFVDPTVAIGSSPVAAFCTGRRASRYTGLVGRLR